MRRRRTSDDRIDELELRRWSLHVPIVGLLGPLCWSRSTRWGNASLGMPLTFRTRRQAREAGELLSSYRGEARVVPVIVTVEMG